MKRYSTSLVIREMQVKTTIKYHDRHIRMAKMKKTDHVKCCLGCGETGTLIQCWWECKMVQPL